MNYLTQLRLLPTVGAIGNLTEQGRILNGSCKGFDVKSAGSGLGLSGTFFIPVLPEKFKKEFPILIGCEESQAVCKEFRKLGFNAFSNDIQDCSGGHPEWHLKMCVFDAIKLVRPRIGIFFPACTDLAVSGSRYFEEKRKDGRQQRAIDFVFRLMESDIESIALENPIGVLSTQFRKPDQIIQPWQFGHGETKATCLWLKNLPLLTPTDIVSGRDPKVWLMPPSVDRAKLRSKTYPGIAAAMANQWGQTILNLNSSPR